MAPPLRHGGSPGLTCVYALPMQAWTVSRRAGNRWVGLGGSRSDQLAYPKGARVNFAAGLPVNRGTRGGQMLAVCLWEPDPVFYGLPTPHAPRSTPTQARSAIRRRHPANGPKRWLPLIYINLPRSERGSLLAHKISHREGRTMLRSILAALAALVLITVTLIPDDASARGRGGGGGGFRGGGGGFHGGGFHGGGYRGGGMHAGRIARPSHPIAGRPIVGRPGRPIAGRPGRPVAGYPGYGYRRGYGAAAVGAAAVGAAAYGAYGYGNYGCYYDNYGQYICPQQYPY